MLPLVIQKDGNARSISVTEPNVTWRKSCFDELVFSVKLLYFLSKKSTLYKFDVK